MNIPLIIYWTALILIVLATLNFVWMAIGPGAKFNLFRLVQDKTKSSKKVMNIFYVIVALAAIYILFINISCPPNCFKDEISV